jgi:thioredoxin 1
MNPAIQGAMSSEKILHLNAATFDATVKSVSVPLLVDFWAPWCGPCRAVAPVLDQIAEELGDAVKIAKVDVNEDENKPLARQHGVQNIPTFLVFKNGQPVARHVGGQSKETLVGELKKWQ